MIRSKSNDRYRKDLRTLDPESAEYWEELLRRDGLSMSAGRDKHLIYKDPEDVDRIEHAIVSDLTCGGGRKVRPKGSKPE